MTRELEIAYRISRGDFVAITGTNGKTTTTTWWERYSKIRPPYLRGGQYRSRGDIQSSRHRGRRLADNRDQQFPAPDTRYFKPAVSAILNITRIISTVTIPWKITVWLRQRSLPIRIKTDSAL